MTDVDGKQIGRNDKLFGAIGTSTIVLIPFTITGPPADNAYAVEPVGVEISMPSPEVVVMYSSLMYISNTIRLQSFLVIATSFSTTLFCPIFPLLSFCKTALSRKRLST